MSGGPDRHIESFQIQEGDRYRFERMIWMQRGHKFVMELESKPDEHGVMRSSVDLKMDGEPPAVFIQDSFPPQYVLVHDGVDLWMPSFREWRDFAFNIVLPL